MELYLRAPPKAQKTPLCSGLFGWSLATPHFISRPLGKAGGASGTWHRVGRVLRELPTICRVKCQPFPGPADLTSLSLALSGPPRSLPAATWPCPPQPGTGCAPRPRQTPRVPGFHRRLQPFPHTHHSGSKQGLDVQIQEELSKCPTYTKAGPLSTHTLHCARSGAEPNSIQLSSAPGKDCTTAPPAPDSNSTDAQIPHVKRLPGFCSVVLGGLFGAED